MNTPMTMTVRDATAYEWDGVDANELRAAFPDRGDEEPIEFMEILKALGFAETLRLTRCAEKYDNHWRRFAVWCAARANASWSSASASRASDIAERYAQGQANFYQLTDAYCEVFAMGRKPQNYAEWAAAEAAAPEGGGEAAWKAAWHARKALGRGEESIQEERFAHLVMNGYF